MSVRAYRIYITVDGHNLLGEAPFFFDRKLLHYTIFFGMNTHAKRELLFDIVFVSVSVSARASARLWEGGEAGVVSRICWYCLKEWRLVL